MLKKSTLNTESSCDRILQVLAVLAQQGRTLSAHELMRITGLARSTLYRYLARLRHWGFVSETHGGYAPGPLSLQLATGFGVASTLVRLAHPAMENLAAQSRESVALIMAVNDQAVCLDMVESTHSLRCSIEKGRSVPLRAVGASAKCVLAYLADPVRQEVLDMHYGEDGPQRQKVAGELDAIRQAGFAVSTGEVDADVWGVSAPVFGSPGHAVAAITLMAPASRATDQEQALIQMTLVTATRISRQLSSV